MSYVRKISAYEALANIDRVAASRRISSTPLSTELSAETVYLKRSSRSIYQRQVTDVDSKQRLQKLIDTFRKLLKRHKKPLSRKHHKRIYTKYISTYDYISHATLMAEWIIAASQFPLHIDAIQQAFCLSRRDLTNIVYRANNEGLYLMFILSHPRFIGNESILHALALQSREILFSIYLYADSENTSPKLVESREDFSRYVMTVCSPYKLEYLCNDAIKKDLEDYYPTIGKLCRAIEYLLKPISCNINDSVKSSSYDFFEYYLSTGESSYDETLYSNISIEKDVRFYSLFSESKNTGFKDKCKLTRTWRDITNTPPPKTKRTIAVASILCKFVHRLKKLSSS